MGILSEPDTFWDEEIERHHIVTEKNILLFVWDKEYMEALPMTKIQFEKQNKKTLTSKNIATGRPSKKSQIKIQTVVSDGKTYYGV